MKVILFGTTGMLGSGALTECLEDTRVTRALIEAALNGADEQILDSKAIRALAG